MKSRIVRFSSLLIAAALLAGCNKPEPQPTTGPTPAPAPAPAPAPTPPPAPAGVTVTGIELGSAIGADQKVAAAKSQFAPTDTIYAVVSTTGSAPSVALAAKWTYQDGQTVNQSAQTIAPTGPAATAFQISKPDGWPAGKYKVEITKDGVAAGSRDFEVK